MKSYNTINALRLLAMGLMLIGTMTHACAQHDDRVPADSVAVSAGMVEAQADSIAARAGMVAAQAAMLTAAGDSVTGAAAVDDSVSVMVTVSRGKARKTKTPRDWSTWKPDPQRAMWLAMVLPGAGQIYNRKFWKLPIFYGGMMGCLYAMNWNNMMYKDYSQAYLDIMDDDPTTQSYNTFLHLGRQIDSSNEERYKSLFKSRKDRYRRWRDMSFFCLIGVYALSVIDAYVDAELSQFDISKDLSLRVEPAVINGSRNGSSLDMAALGLQCSIIF